MINFCTCSDCAPVSNASHLKIDPSRTAPIQRRFVAHLNRLSAELRSSLRQMPAFTGDHKLMQAGSWLDLRISLIGYDGLWSQEYIRAAYLLGTKRAFEMARPQTYTANADEQKVSAAMRQGSYKQFLESAFTRPQRKEVLETLYARVVRELKGFSDTLRRTLGRIVADGFSRGAGAGKIASQMAKTADGLTRSQARTIVRTETARAAAEGQLDSFEELGVGDDLDLDAEITTAKDPCPTCAKAAQKTYTIEQARGLIPLHPNCRCGWKIRLTGITANKGTSEGVKRAWLKRKRKVKSKILSRAQRARLSHKTATVGKQQHAEKNEQVVARVINGKTFTDNRPVDVLTRKHAIEVKTMFPGANPKITMHADALVRKYRYARQHKVKWHTVAIEAGGREGAYYNRRFFYREGIGSFNIYKMQEISLKQLRKLIR